MNSVRQMMVAMMVTRILRARLCSGGLKRWGGHEDETVWSSVNIFHITLGQGPLQRNQCKNGSLEFLSTDCVAHSLPLCARRWKNQSHSFPRNCEHNASQLTSPQEWAALQKCPAGCSGRIREPPTGKCSQRVTNVSAQEVEKERRFHLSCLTTFKHENPALQPTSWPWRGGSIHKWIKSLGWERRCSLDTYLSVSLDFKVLVQPDRKIKGRTSKLWGTSQKSSVIC